MSRSAKNPDVGLAESIFGLRSALKTRSNGILSTLSTKYWFQIEPLISESGTDSWASLYFGYSLKIFDIYPIEYPKVGDIDVPALTRVKRNAPNHHLQMSRYSSCSELGVFWLSVRLSQYRTIQCKFQFLSINHLLVLLSNVFLHENMNIHLTSVAIYR